MTNDDRIKAVATKIVNARHAPIHTPYGDVQLAVLNHMNELKTLMEELANEAKDSAGGPELHSKEMALSIYEDAGNVADAILSLDKVIHGMRIWM